MHIKSLVRFVALLGALALAVPAMAKPISKHINIASPAKVGSTHLKAGEYHLLIDGTKVTVHSGSKVVAEVEGRWEQRDRKSQNDAVLLGPNGEVKEIRFAGDNRVLLLTAP